MGIYDTINGKCPHCGYFIEGIQTKQWITTGRSTTYTFKIGDNVPYLVDHITNEPIIEPIQEFCYNCNYDFKIIFEIRKEKNNNQNDVIRVYIKSFEEI